MQSSSSDPFQIFPIQIWVLISSFLSFTDRDGKKTHHSLCLTSKAANRVTNNDFIWQVRLSLIGLHFGYCYVDEEIKKNDQDSSNSSSFDGFQNLLLQRQLRDEQFRTRPSLFSALTLPLVGKQRIQNDNDAMSIFSKLRLRRKFISGNDAAAAAKKVQQKQNARTSSTSSSKEENSEEDQTVCCYDSEDAPIAWALFVPHQELHNTKIGNNNNLKFSWKYRLLYLHFLTTMKCCLCAKEIISRMSEQDDVRKGMEFYFHDPSVENMIVNTFNDNHFSFEERVKNGAQREYIRDQLSTLLPWSGLRICGKCLAFLNVSFQQEEPSQSREQQEQEQEHHNFQNRTAVRREREGSKNYSSLLQSQQHGKRNNCLGPVCLLPIDFEILSGAEKRKKMLSKKPLGYLMVHHQIATKKDVNNNNNNSWPCDPFGLLDYLAW